MGGKGGRGGGGRKENSADYKGKRESQGREGPQKWYQKASAEH